MATKLTAQQMFDWAKANNLGFIRGRYEKKVDEHTWICAVELMSRMSGYVCGWLEHSNVFILKVCAFFDISVDERMAIQVGFENWMDDDNVSDNHPASFYVTNYPEYVQVGIDLARLGGVTD